MLRKLLWLAAAVAVAIGALEARRFFAPAAEVRRAFGRAVEAFEEERLLASLAVLDRAYADRWGNSYESLAGTVRLLHETYDGLELTYEWSGIEVDGDSAVMDLTFILWGRAEGRRGTVVGSVLEPCTATVVWSRQPQGWRVVTVTALDIPELRDELDS